MRVSIIVPVVNEAQIIQEFLVRLDQCAPAAEVIVVDGGSTDATVEICAHTKAYVLQAPLGRAKQMNAGAKIATGDVFWFVHADSAIHPQSIACIEHALADASVVGGCFRLAIDSSRWIYRVRDAVGNFLVDLTSLALGDRGFFCRREAFESVGGFPEIELMEDAEFYRALNRVGRTVQLGQTIATSPRRYERMGPAATMLFYTFIMTLFAAHVPRRFLAPMIMRFHKQRGV